MVERYFEKFPVIEYANTQAVDITRRTVLLDKVSRNPYVYYPYEISGSERADQFSFRYYNDPYQSWIVYLTNKIVDPYYEWYLSESELNEFCDKKYGSNFLARQKVKFYRNNWIGADTIDTAAYEALLVGNKKYWEPVYTFNDQIIAYKRTEKDWIVNTNKIVAYAVANNSFRNDEICNIVFSNNYIGKGQVSSVNEGTLYLQHMSGTFLSNSVVTITGNSYIYGTESQTNSTFTTSTLIANNIPSAEEIYWAPVTYYQYESEKNEYNKTIRVLDSNFSQTMSDNLKQLLRE